jgi:hypothetical protein
MEWVVSFTPQPHYLRYLLDRWFGGPQKRFGRCDGKKHFLLYRESNSGSADHRPAIMLTELMELIIVAFQQ